MSESNGGSGTGGGRGPTTGGGGAGLLYKPGEGYWVRVMTAVLIAALFLSAAAWGFKSLEALSIPYEAWEFNLRVAGPVTPGQEVEIVSAGTAAEGGAVRLGTAKIQTVTPGTSGDSIVRLTDVQMVGKASPEDARNQVVRVGPAGVPHVTGVVISTTGIPLFERLYLQSGVAAALLLIGAALAYYLAGVRPYTVDFLIATDNEMKKVNWSTRREIMGSTYVVVTACLLIATALFITDYAFSHFFMAIDVLKSK